MATMRKNLPEILQKHEAHKKESYFHDLFHETEYERLSLSQNEGHTRAYMKIQDGCNQFCSYCIIPYTRGRVRSRELLDIRREAQALANHGYQEIVLTGIHLDSYGVDLPEGEGDLLKVVREVGCVEGIRRIRLGSLEPRIMTETFVRALSMEEKLCPHFHLSLQSGCDATLKRMNRRYDTEEFRACCRRLRMYFDQPALTTDVIVGFPGETEEEFARTVEFLKEICFFETHVFKYSRRKGTRADGMEGQVQEEIKTKRSEILLALSEANRREYQKRLIGRTVEVLMEESCIFGDTEYQIGHTREYVPVAVAGKEPLSNQLLQVKVDDLPDFGMLCGHLGNADRK